MCLAIPGRIIAINHQQATADFDGIKKEINISLVEVKKGDFVMVHAGFAIEKMKKKEADDIFKILKNGQKNGKIGRRN